MADLSAMPGLFLAYPSNQPYRDSMSRFVEELRADGAMVEHWDEATEPGFLWRVIQEKIDRNELLIAEATLGNPNVLFELGYAIGAGKHTVALRDNTASAPVIPKPMEPIFQIRYDNRPDIRNQLSDVLFTGRRLREELGIGPEPGPGGRLYFLPMRNAGDLNECVRAVLKAGPFDIKTTELTEADYDNLGAQANSIATASLFIGILASTSRLGAWTSNAQTMLYAGVAAGLKKQFVLLAEQPQTRLLDLGENVIDFTTESDVESRLPVWLNAAARREFHRAPVAPASTTITPPVGDGFLSKVFLGNLDARADFTLHEYFVETPEFRQARRADRHLFVGAKGAGKTALFEMLCYEFEHQRQVLITIAPAEFEFPHLSAVLDEHVGHAHQQFIYGSFWRFILVTEIVRGVRERFLDYLLQSSGLVPDRRGPAKARRMEPPPSHFSTGIIEWLSEHDHLLQMDFVSRVVYVLQEIESFSGSDDQRRSAYETLLQTSRLYGVEEHLAEFAAEYDIRLLIDDLDRNWAPTSDSSKQLIVSMLNALHDLRDRLSPGLKPAVFIRSDVYVWLEGHDPEITKRDAAVLDWNRESLQQLIALRIRSRGQLTGTDPDSLWDLVFPHDVAGERTVDFVINRTQQRPRDVLQFCRAAIQSAQRGRREIVSEADLLSAWDQTGELILSQIETEYRFRFPGLGALALAFLDRPASQLWSDLRARLRSLTVEEPWIQAEQAGDCMGLLEALYRTGVVGFAATGSTIWGETTRSFDALKPLISDTTNVVLHRAFRRYMSTNDDT